MPDERLLEKARNLLALAENAGSPAEADTAREKAEAMMLRHSIDMALLHEAAPSPVEVITTREVVIAAPYARQKSCILTAVAEVHRVRTVSHRPDRKNRMRCTVIGYSSDLQHVSMLFTSLLLQASREVMTTHPPGGVFHTEDTAAYRRSWLLGFAGEVRGRLQRLHQQQQTHADAEHTGTRGTELILADRQAAVNATVAGMFPNLRAARNSSTGTGARAGREAGARADLGQTRVTGGRRALAR